MNGFAASRPSGMVSSVGATAPLPESASRRSVLGRGLGFHHHDGDVAVLEHPAGHDHVERGLSQLGVGREGHPLALDQRDPDAADRAGERQAGQLGRQRGGVDRDDVVQVLGVERHDRLDDLDLIAQAVHERRPQRPVDQPAGKDRVLGRATLTAEERAGNPARRIHPLLHVDGEREEVEVVLRLLGGCRRRQHHGLVVEIDDGGPGRQAG